MFTAGTDLGQGLPDFVKNEILEVVRDELSGAVQISLSERLHNEIAEVVKERLFEILGDSVTEIVQNEIRKTVSEEGRGGYAPRRKVRPKYELSVSYANTWKKRRVTEDEDPNELIPEERLDTSRFPWPISYPSEIPATPASSQEVITVDAYATKTHHADLIVGRALPSSCLDPNIRPLVRAKLIPQTFETSHKYSVYTYMPSKYGKVPNRMGELQIPSDEVEFLAQFDASTRQERSAKMAAALKHAASPLSIIDTYTGSSFLDWDIIIGRARPEMCADPSTRPLVRASLTVDEKVVAYMPARYGVDRNKIDGELGVPMRNVEVWREFDAPTELRRRENIKDALVRKREGRVGEGCPGVFTGRGAGEGGSEGVDG